MRWPNGRHLISQISFQFNGKTENLSFYVISDDEVDSYFFNVCRGDYLAPQPDVVIQPFMLFNASTADKAMNTNLAGVMANITADLNKKLQSVYGGSVPITFIEQLEVAISKMALFLAGSIPQIK